MSLRIGDRLGHYDVAALIGEGGMGEVYRARDTTLDRDVALKVLPEAFTQDPDRLTRFEREAKVLASLNHPSIGHIYGLEEADGIRALVLELVEGPTLADRIKQGPIPLDEALPIAKQIAEALEAAHEAGVIHRDLKPANIKVREDGIVKVLDFGLAKALAGDVPTADLSQSPTVTASGTRAGVILGTATYMSPEQACLDKDPRDRLRDIGDARVEIREATTAPLTEAAAAVSAAPHAVGWQRAMPWVVGVTLGVISGLAVWTLTRPGPQVPQPQARFVVTTPPDGPLRLTGSQTDLAISPDGTRLVYMSDTGGDRFGAGRQLYIRDINQLVATALPGTEGARSPFFSPDGEWVGFQDTRDDVIKRVPVSGGTALRISETGGPLLGMSWGPDNTIVFADFGSRGLLRVPAVGGEPEVLTSVDPEQRGVEHFWPEFLPGGNAVLFGIGMQSDIENAQIAVLSLESGEQKVVFRGGSNPHYLPTGHLVYGVDRTLWAVPFDLDRLEVTGDAAPVLTDVMTKARGAANVTVAWDGTLVYVSGTRAVTTGSELVLVDREGRSTPATEVTADYRSPRFAPDGRRLAVAIDEGQGAMGDIGASADIWVLDLDRGTRTNVTFEDINSWPIWSPDGSRLAFTTQHAGRADVHWVPADGSGQPQELFAGDANFNVVTSWSSDGRTMAYLKGSTNATADLWVLALDGDPTPSPFLESQFFETAATFSPDGGWLAYISNKSGRNEVYVRPYPGPGGEAIISTGGGQEPVWAPDGSELFYRNGAQMLAVKVETDPTFSTQTPELLFEAGYALDAAGFTNYDISPDGQQFVMVTRASEGAGDSAQINIVLNWFEELTRLVPVN